MRSYPGMSKTTASRSKSNAATDELRKSEMMAHLLDALDRGKDIGHYGRLVFAMVGPGSFHLEEVKVGDEVDG